ncbi:DHX35 [Hepatospora eriocheir]|uniref:DHX35 n=1 Tax=Hepatospora eriocheir TaxID=1081669 RepID=A0A1X0Q8X5_9MICR|nr:DHX35 [Hepatospora eriocheir]
MDEENLRKYKAKKQRLDLRQNLLDELSKYSIKNTEAFKKKKIKKDKKIVKKTTSVVTGDKKKTSFKILKQNEDSSSETEEVKDYNELIKNEKNIEITENVQEEFNDIYKYKLSRFLNRKNEIIDFRKSLDIFYHENDIISVVKSNLVVFIQGNTGCGKSTQIPQMLMEYGFANEKKIVMTQPRRINCVGVANRINEEVNENVCGYRYMFEDKVSFGNKTVVMTEALLLMEIKNDNLLSSYSVIILDEVHERSIYIDILISVLSKIVKIRKEKGDYLRLVFMSATVDNIENYRNHFNFTTLESILIETTKKFKVDEIFLGNDKDYLKTITEKIISIILKPDFDMINKSMLVFLPSKNEIYSMRTKLLECCKLYDLFENSLIDIVPLHSSLNKAEQAKIYKNNFKIILATNIAETSITIKDIYYVFDSGRVKYKVCDESITKYKTGFITKSSAKQRSGRLGRVSDGICFRAYSAQNYANFSEENVPQIQMQDITSIILFIKNLGFRILDNFPWFSKPSEYSLSSSQNHLRYLGFLDKSYNVTDIGMVASLFPVKPRLARVILSYDRSSYNIFVLVAILSLNIELKENTFTIPYYHNSKSDYIVLLKIYKDFLNSSDQSKFASDIKISINLLHDVKKLTNRLISIYKKVVYSDSVITEVINIYEFETELSVLLANFKDQIAIKYNDLYLFRNDEVYVDSNSINTEAHKIVFEYLICTSSKVYLKNVSILED